jgi:hypothetical protein
MPIASPSGYGSPTSTGEKSRTEVVWALGSLLTAASTSYYTD